MPDHENMYDTAQPQGFYRIMNNDFYGDADAPDPKDEYSKCGPAESPQCGIYEQPVHHDESAANPYEVPQSLLEKK